MNKLHQEYRWLRVAGWPAQRAWRAAKTTVAFEAAAESGLVRFRVVADEDTWPPSDVADMGLRPSEAKRERERLTRQCEDWGVWGIVSEVLCPCCGQWMTVDSVWGFVGDSWRRSAYDTDVMDAALAKLGGAQHATN